ncbi:MAG: glutathione S-transferase family protein [Hydrogenovibrio sp.]|jgi:glutathione S-transferase
MASTTTEKMELISFKLCPFVQRAVIVLKKKQVDFDLTFIDLSNPPEWFESLSPLGKVPVLKVGKEVLFESMVIQEYVDEVTPPSLHPKDPLKKAMNRAWMTFGDDLNILQFKMSHATDQAAFESFRDEINGKLARLESVHSGERFFNGEDFCLIDAAYAPFFMRLSLMKNLCSIDFLDGFPKMQAWSKALLSQDCVIDSVVPELPSMYQNMIRNVENGYLANMA